MRWLGMIVGMALALVTVGCEEPFRPITLERLEIVSGADQSGFEGQPLPERILVRTVTDRGGPFFGKTVFARIQSGNGGVRAGGASGSGTGAAVAAVAWDTVSFEWTMGPADEEQALSIFALEGSDTVRTEVMATVLELPEG